MLDPYISDITICGKHTSKGDVSLNLALRRSDHNKTVHFWLELNVEGRVYKAVSDLFDLWEGLLEGAQSFIAKEDLEWTLWGIHKNQLVFSHSENNQEIDQILLKVNLSLNVDGVTILEEHSLYDIYIEFNELKTLVDEIERLYPEYQPPSPWVDLSYQETVDHIGWIRDPQVEDDIKIYYIGLVDSTFPESNPDELIFHPNLWFNDESMLHVKLSNEKIAQYLMSWTGKRLIGAKTIDLPDIPDSKAPPA